jgi:hypothetical protein
MIQPQGHSVTGRIMSLKNSNDIGNQTHDLWVCGAVPRMCVYKLKIQLTRNMVQNSMLLLSRNNCQIINLHSSKHLKGHINETLCITNF